MEVDIIGDENMAENTARIWWCTTTVKIIEFIEMVAFCFVFSFSFIFSLFICQKIQSFNTLPSWKKILIIMFQVVGVIASKVTG